MEGQGSGTFAGVAGFGSGGAVTTPISPAGVYGQGGFSRANGVEGRGTGAFAGVLGLGEGAAPTAAAFIPPASAAESYGIAGTTANNGDNNGVEGRGNGKFAGVAGFGDDASASANSEIGVFAVGGAPIPNSGRAGGPGVYAIGNGGPSFSPATQVTQPVGVFAVGGGDNAPGIYGVGAGGPAFGAVSAVTQAPGVFEIGGIQADGPGVLGHGAAALADGVQGLSQSGNGVLGDSAKGIGVRAISTSSTALAAIGSTGLIATSTAPNGTAAEFAGNVLVNGGLMVKGGPKSAAVAFPDGSHRRLYCVESPESWFEDFGFGTVSDGEAEVELDPGFRAIVDGDAYHVFITEYDSNNALYVTGRSRSGFLVRAKDRLAAGTFSYRVVAKRRDIPALRFERVELPSRTSLPRRKVGRQLVAPVRSSVTVR